MTDRIKYLKGLDVANDREWVATETGVWTVEGRLLRGENGHQERYRQYSAQQHKNAEELAAEYRNATPELIKLVEMAEFALSLNPTDMVVGINNFKKTAMEYRNEALAAIRAFREGK